MYEIRCPHCGRTNIRERRICLVCGKEIRPFGGFNDSMQEHERAGMFTRILIILLIIAAMIVMVRSHFLDKLFVG